MFLISCIPCQLYSACRYFMSLAQSLNSDREEPQVGFVNYETNLVFDLTFNLHLSRSTYVGVNTDERGGEWRIGFAYSHLVFLRLKVKKTLSHLLL